MCEMYVKIFVCLYLYFYWICKYEKKIFIIIEVFMNEFILYLVFVFNIIYIIYFGE